MNTVVWRRLMFLAALPLCGLLLISGARAEEAAASAAEDRAQEQSDWQDRSERHPHYRHHRERQSNDDLISVGHDSTLEEAREADSVVSILGSSTSNGHSDEVVSILGDTRVTGQADDDAVAVLGSVYIDGKVGGDAVAVLGNVQLGPHADIEGDVVAVGGTVTRDAEAIVHGSTHNVFAFDFGHVEWLRTWIHRCLFFGRPLAFSPGLGWAWGLALTLLGLYACLALLFREGLIRCVQTFEAQPGQSVVAALVAMLLTPVLVVLLCITVIGIAAVPLLGFALLCISLFGKAVMLAWVGRRVTGQRTAGALSHPVLSVLIGGALVLVLYVVPVVGFVVYKLLGLLGLGAVVYTLIQTTKARQAAAKSGAPAGDQSAPVPPPASAPSHAPVPEPISATLPRAGFWIRMGALLIDTLLIGFVTSLVSHDLELFALAVYGAVMWKTRGATVGGIVFDLHVVRQDGRPVDWETAIVRALGCFLSLAVAGLGFIWIAFDPNRQAWHDKIAGTVVVRVAKGVPLV